MTRFTLGARPAAVVQLATFDSANDIVVTRSDSANMTFEPPAAHAERPPFDWDTQHAPVDPSVKGWPAVGMTQGKDIQVLLRRIDLDVAAKLDLWSSDPAVLEPGLFDQGHDAIVNLISKPEATPSKRATPHLVRIEARWKGQLVAGLAVYVHPPLVVKLNVFRINPRRGAATGKVAWFPDLAPALVHTNAIWRQAGIEFQLVKDAWQDLEVAHDPDTGLTDDDTREAFRAARKTSGKGVVNVHLADRSTHHMGLAFTKGVHLHDMDETQWGPPHMLIWAQWPPPKVKGGTQPDSHWKDDPNRYSRTFGHELGHYFEMEHPAVGAPPPDKAVRSLGVQRLLMSHAQPKGLLIPPGYDEWVRTGGWIQGHDGKHVDDQGEQIKLQVQGSVRPRAMALKHGYVV